MQTNTNSFSTLKFVLLFCLSMAFSLSASAHLMVAQHGTLNLVGDDVFMVLSLPVSAFAGIDDDKDSKLSATEFKTHKAAISDAIKEHIVLRDKTGIRPIKGLMLSPVTPHGSANESATQLVVMGRYALKDADSPLYYQFDLFGKEADEKLMEITATRRSDMQKTVMQITPTLTQIDVFAAAD